MLRAVAIFSSKNLRRLGYYKSLLSSREASLLDFAIEPCYSLLKKIPDGGLALWVINF